MIPSNIVESAADGGGDGGACQSARLVFTIDSSVADLLSRSPTRIVSSERRASAHQLVIFMADDDEGRECEEQTYICRSLIHKQRFYSLHRLKNDKNVAW